METEAKKPCNVVRVRVRVRIVIWLGHLPRNEENLVVFLLFKK